MTHRRTAPKARGRTVILSGLLIALFSITTQAHARCGVTLVGYDGSARSELNFLAYGYPNGFAHTFKSGNVNFQQRFENLQNLAEGDISAIGLSFDLLLAASPYGSLASWGAKHGLKAILDEAGVGYEHFDYTDPQKIYDLIAGGSGVTWDQVGWNDKLEEIHFASLEDGGCEGAQVSVWRDTDFRGDVEVVSYPGQDGMVHISSLAMGKEASSYFVSFNALQVTGQWVMPHEDVAATPDAFIAVSGGNLYSTGTNSQMGEVTAKRVAGSPDGSVYFVGMNNKLYKYGSGLLQNAPNATARDIEIGLDGAVYFIGLQHGYRHKAGRGMIGNENLQAMAIDTFPGGAMAQVNAGSNDLYYYDENGRSLVYGGARSEGTALDADMREDGAVFFVGEDHRVYRFTRASGTRLVWSAPVASRIAVTGERIAVGSRDQQTVFFLTDPDYPTPRPVPPRPEPRVLPPSTFETLGQSTLPTDFAIEADVTINWSESYNNIVTIGGPEYGNQAALRLQAGEQGQWYVAVGDGAAFNDQYFEGHWEFGTPFRLRVTYDHQSTHTSVYENGERVLTYSPVPVPSGMTGTVVLGANGAGPSFNAQVSDFQID
ncbi:MAG: hypothetical protein HOH74_03895 [Gemmatimonadetes bacterium]|nr:hypothetical protein [Gemmatimonadota bacterium]